MCCGDHEESVWVVLWTLCTRISGLDRCQQISDYGVAPQSRSLSHSTQRHELGGRSPISVRKEPVSPCPVVCSLAFTIHRVADSAFGIRCLQEGMPPCCSVLPLSTSLPGHGNIRCNSVLITTSVESIGQFPQNGQLKELLHESAMAAC